MHMAPYKFTIISVVIIIIITIIYYYYYYDYYYYYYLIRLTKAWSVITSQFDEE